MLLRIVPLVIAGLFSVAPIRAYPHEGHEHEKAAPERGERKEATLATAQLTITGMHCPMCSAAIKKKVRELPGVQSCEVDHAKGSGTVTYNPMQTTPQAIIDAVKAAGFSATLQ